MKLLVVSDEESSFIWDYFNPEIFSGVDMVISAGDLKRQYLEFLACVIPAPLLYVPGNHDKAFEANPPDGCIPLDGRVEICKGVRIAGLGGCRSGAVDRAFEYSDPEMCRLAKKLSRQIKRACGLDILVTHAPPLGLGDGEDSFHRGFSSFLWLMDEYCPKLHIFGHQHKRYGHGIKTPEYYKSTRLLNACGYKIVEI